MTTTTKRRRHTPEQADRSVREGERLPNEGRDPTEVLRHLEVSEATWNRWRNSYEGTKADEARRLQELERENARLKKPVADEEPGIDTLEEPTEGKVSPRSDAVGPRAGSRNASGCPNGRRPGGRPAALHAAPAPRPRPDEERRLRRRLRAIARARPRWGWRTAHRPLRREGVVINEKRTRRPWRDEGLRRPVRCRKRRRAATGTAARLRAERPNQAWALDFSVDETTDGRRPKPSNVVDEFGREALAVRVGRTCDADTVVAVIEALVAQRGAPEHLRMDDGPELVAWALRCGCRLAGTRTAHVEPGSPWQTPFVESHDGRVRDELLNTEGFATLLEAQVVVEARRVEHDTCRPHGRPDGLTSAEFEARRDLGHRPALP